MNTSKFNESGLDRVTPRSDEERSVSEILADAQRELERVDDLLRSYLQYVCDRISLQRGMKDWYRLASESRIKDANSVAGQLRKQQLDVRQIWSINDIVGARVVVLTRADARRVADFIFQDNPTFAQQEGPKDIHNNDGYRAIHLKGRVVTNTAAIGFEIQIRTALQDAWAVVSRGSLYGHEADASLVRDTARLLADQLATADESLELIRNATRRPEPLEEVASLKADLTGKGET